MPWQAWHGCPATKAVAALCPKETSALRPTAGRAGRRCARPGCVTCDLLAWGSLQRGAMGPQRHRDVWLGRFLGGVRGEPGAPAGPVEFRATGNVPRWTLIGWSCSAGLSLLSPAAKNQSRTWLVVGAVMPSLPGQASSEDAAPLRKKTGLPRCQDPGTTHIPDERDDEMLKH